MSLLSTLEQTIRAYKDQQAEIDANIRLLKEILKSLVSQPKSGFDASEVKDEAGDAAADPASPPGQKDDIDLLDQALEKALKIRSGIDSSKKHTVRNKFPGCEKEQGPGADSANDRTMSASIKGCQKITKSSSKPACVIRKGNHKDRSSASSRHAASFRSGHSKTTNNRNIIQEHLASSAGLVHHQAASASASANDISTRLSKNKNTRNNMLCDDNLEKSASVSTTSPNSVTTVSHTEKSGESGVFQQDGVPPGEAIRWKSLKRRQNRLWDKVVAVNQKHVAGRSRFMERMRTTFPKDWPCGSPDQTRVLLNRLTHRGRDLLQLRPVNDVLPTSKTHRELVSDEGKTELSLTKEELEHTVEEFRNQADQVIQEWKAWNRWSPEGGCLCATEASCVWADGMTAPLPLSVTYTTEAELQELERLRMTVALLQQENSLQQALSEALAPQLLSAVPESGFPNPSVLRDLYSLLGEGGERFPAIVLDSEHD
ncbi:uncharacterized protein tedc2 isoform X2 [Gouania willdenowi]|nr:uncharacterized protein LOC114469026 isoform X2 [Gouania willdenowi]XP_028312049.1 uncharacterized protein LOC114469026 isoform X2 [Gouania willdenowi]XP_028312050.1 uncharacterized protein LOC114469026 isoform X2 [Gouania willdenowi]